MAHCLYVKGYKPDTTLDQLVIYFQSKESGGGDIDDEHCELQEDFAIIAFDEKEDCDSVLRGENHILKNGSKLTISPEPFKTPPIAKPRNIPPRKQRNNSDKNPPQLPAIEKPIIDEIRTVIVSGICPETTNGTLQNLFENKRRSGGGDMENFKRIEPQIAHITFSSSQVALSVLKKEHLEVDGYLLKLEAKKPKVTFPTDKKKLYVENLGTKTSKDSLLNYVEVITGLEVTDVVFGKNNNATVTLNEEPDMNKTREKAKKKPLEGAVLKITNPPVCNSILVTGISEETTKDSIVFKFENPKYGGGDILDIAYQQDQGKAVISYYDPNVINRMVSTEHKLNDSKLTVRRHYPFMESHDEHVVESKKKVITVKPNVMDQYLSEQLSEKSLTIEKESVSLLKDEKWRNFRDALTEKFGIKVFIIGNVEVEVWLTGENNQVQKAYKELKEFVKFNTIISESIVLHRIGRYLEKFGDSKIKEIEQRLKKDFVQLKKGKKEGTLFLQGTKEGVAEAKIMIQEIILDVAHRFIPIEEPGMQKYLQTESGKISLEGLESKHHCTITLTNNNTKQRATATASGPSSTLLCSFETPERMMLQVYEADITNYRCDVIVNAANGDLKHIGGLAKMIADKGGKEIQEDCNEYVKRHGSLYPGECYSGIPGKLQCKRIIHAVGPRWNNVNRVRHKQLLQTACEDSLKHAKTYSTIALPAIGSGIYGVPKDVCASVMVEAAENFSSESKGQYALQEIHFVNNDSTTAQYFAKEFKKRFSGKRTFLDKSCEIVFDKMQETNKNTGEKTEVVRKDLKAKAYTYLFNSQGGRY